MEFLRIFNKKRILILALLFVINGLFFIRECSEIGKYKVYNDLVVEFNNKTESAVDIKKTALFVLEEYKNDHENISEDENYLEVRKMFMDKVEYVRDYSRVKTKQIENSKAMLSSSIFSDKTSFSYLNAVKTRNVLEKIKDENVTVSNGVWLEKIVDYKPVYYIIMVAVAMIIYAFIEDRKTGIVYIQYAAANGRAKLFARRLGILLTTTVVITMLFFGELAVISLNLYGGVEGLNASVCSDEMFAMCSMGMTRLVWFLINVLRVSMSVFVMGLLMWGILTYFNNSNIGLCAYLLLYGVEIVANALITEKSVFRFVKFFNLTYLVDSGDAWFSYGNWGYRYIIMDIAESTGVLMVVIGLVSVAMIVRSCVMYNPLSRTSFIEKMFMSLYDLFMRLFSKLPVAVMELFKLVVSQRVGVVVIAVVALFANMNKGYVLTYSMNMVSVVQMCEESKEASVDELISMREELYKEKSAYENDTSQHIGATFKTQIVQSKIDALDYVIQKNSVGVKVSLISPYEYEAAFGGRQSDNQEYIAMLCIIVMLTINAGTLSYEKRKGMMKHIRASKNRSEWIKRKIIRNGLFATFITMIMYGWYYYELIKLYKLGNYNISIQSFAMFDKYPLDIPIWGFVVLDLLLKIAVLMAVGGVAFLISGMFNYEVGYFVALLVILPHLLYKLGISVLSYVSIPKIMAFFPYWMEGKGIYNMTVDVIIIVIGAISYAYGVRKVMVNT